MIIPVNNDIASMLIISRTVDITTKEIANKLKDCIDQVIGEKGKLSKAMKEILYSYLLYLEDKNASAVNEFIEIINDITKEHEYEVTENTILTFNFKDNSIELIERNTEQGSDV
ncbi:MAG: hypothetical protein PHY47_12765 [Lachnospiraceae bacterium]|nr:hypothetical protein [Lachnospiraceae bacterium]